MNFVRAAALLACANPIFAQFGGPSILVRGQAPTGMAASQIDFTPSLGVNASYNSGLGGVSLDAQGLPTNDSSYGISVNAGISGTHLWKHTRLGLNYGISAQHYTQASFFDGINQNLSLGLTHSLSRHSVLSINIGAGISSQNNTAPTLLSTVPFDPGTLYRPTNDFFDNRTAYGSTQVNLTMQRSTRLSFSLGVTGNLTRRRSTALFGDTGEGARGDMQYRLSRRSTVGVGYNYNHFTFTGIASSTDVHAVVGTYSLLVARGTEFSGFAGVARYETKFVQFVALDPVVAALLGITSAQRVTYSSNFTPNFSLRLSHVVKRGSISGGVTRGILPGNGLFLTSTNTSYLVAYSYSGLRRWSVGTSASYNVSDSVGNVLGQYKNYSANLNVGRRVAPHTNGIFNFSMNHADSLDFKSYNKWQYSVNLGLNFTPGDVTVRFW